MSPQPGPTPHLSALCWSAEHSFWWFHCLHWSERERPGVLVGATWRAPSASPWSPHLLRLCLAQRTWRLAGSRGFASSHGSSVRVCALPFGPLAAPGLQVPCLGASCWQTFFLWPCEQALHLPLLHLRGLIVSTFWGHLSWCAPCSGWERFGV